MGNNWNSVDAEIKAYGVDQNARAAVVTNSCV